MSTIEQSVEVEAPLSAVYNQWTLFEEFPKFMEGVEEIKQQDDTHMHWVAEIGGSRHEWDAEITEQKPDERVAWRNTDGKDNAGVVTFHRLDDANTRVMVQLDFVPEGIKEKLGDALGAPDRRVKGDLQRFKDLVESSGGSTRGLARRGEAPRRGLGRSGASICATEPPLVSCAECRSRSPRSPRGRGSSITRSTASWRGSPTSCASAGTGSSWSRLPTRASWSERAGPRCRRPAPTPTPSSTSPGCASVLAVGQSLPFRRGGSVSLPLDVSRTLEDLLDHAELDFVHVHEPFAPSASSAALRHSRALNVGTFHSTTERFVSTQVARKVVELLFGRLDGRTASFAATRDLIERYFPGDYRVIRPGADLLHRPEADEAPPRDRPLRRGGAGCAAAVPACAAPPPARARLARDDLAARPGLGARRVAVPAPARAGHARRPGRRLRGPAPGARDDRGGRLHRRRPGAAARAARARRGSRAGRLAPAPVRGGAARRRARPAVRATRCAHPRRPARTAGRRPGAGRGVQGAHRRRPARPRLGQGGRGVRGAVRGDRGAPPRQRAPRRPAAARRARLHPRRPAHAHRPLAGLRDAGRRRCSRPPRGSAWERSR